MTSVAPRDAGDPGAGVDPGARELRARGQSARRREGALRRGNEGARPRRQRGCAERIRGGVRAGAKPEDPVQHGDRAPGPGAQRAGARGVRHLPGRVRRRHPAREARPGGEAPPRIAGKGRDHHHHLRSTGCDGFDRRRGAGQDAVRWPGLRRAGRASSGRRSAWPTCRTPELRRFSWHRADHPDRAGGAVEAQAQAGDGGTDRGVYRRHVGCQRRNHDR